MPSELHPTRKKKGISVGSGHVPQSVVNSLAGGEHENEHHLTDREVHDGLGEHGIERVE